MSAGAGSTPTNAGRAAAPCWSTPGSTCSAREGAAATTVRAVCHKAELNARYFYESFDDIDALLVAVYDHVVAGMSTATAAVSASPDMAPLVVARIGIDAIVRFIDEDRRRARILYVEAASNAALNRHRRETDIVAIATLEQAAVEAAGSWPEGERVSRIGAAMLIGGLSEVLLDWIDGRIDVTREQLVDDLAVLSLGARRSHAENCAVTCPPAADPLVEQS